MMESLSSLSRGKGTLISISWPSAFRDVGVAYAGWNRFQSCRKLKSAMKTRRGYNTTTHDEYLGTESLKVSNEALEANV